MCVESAPAPRLMAKLLLKVAAKENSEYGLTISYFASDGVRRCACMPSCKPM